MLDFIINILSTPAILVGLLSLLGLVLQGKPVEEVVKGTVKTIVGFLVLSAGSSFLQTGSLNALVKFSTMHLICRELCRTTRQSFLSHWMTLRQILHISCVWE